MKSKATVSVSLVHALSLYATSIGVDMPRACRHVGFKPDLLDNPEMRLPAREFYDLWREVANQSGDPDFGLHFAESTRSQLGDGILAAVMVNCPTVGRALEKLIQYHALSTDIIQVRLRLQGRNAVLSGESFPRNSPLDRQISEAVVSRLFFTLENLSRGGISALEIRFRHPQPLSITEHRRIFGCSLTFEHSVDEIVFPAAGLDLPIPLANPKLLAPLDAIAKNLLDELYPPDTWADQVSHSISGLLLGGQKPGIGLVAQELAISARHLQNKLKAEGVTYRVLLDQVRKEMALGYLKEPKVNIYDVAFLLGFSDQSSFNHAFKRWTGMTPGEFRDL